MNSAIVASRRFTELDQQEFASSCGDVNPMHMDATFARRTQAGAPVVHGIHAMLWALECVADLADVLCDVQKVKVDFTRFIYVGKEVHVVMSRKSDTVVNVELRSEEMTLMSIRLSSVKLTEMTHTMLDDTPELKQVDSAIELQFAQMKGLSGSLVSPSQDEWIEANFPTLCAGIGLESVKSISLMSTIVGMYCPGLHSIFSGLTFRFSHMLENLTGVRFDVSSTDERFNLVSLKVEGNGLSGEITAFVRQQPIVLPSIADLQSVVQANVYSDVNALIIGGSRGLGAATARLIAAGGGGTTISYARGVDDANLLADEINDYYGGDRCTVIRYDALEPVDDQLQLSTMPYTHVYYFATTQIFRQKSDSYDSLLFQEFTSVYVDGFSRLCSYLLSKSDGQSALEVFYPSSTAITERPRGMTEYAMAKAAGELLCADITAGVSGIKIRSVRLPRAQTDQTATVTPVPSADAISLMQPIVDAYLAS